MAREASVADLDNLNSEFLAAIRETDMKQEELEKTMEARNHEIKLLMHRVQELSSQYTAVKKDPIDVAMARYINGFRPAVPFFRLAPGLYMFGRRQVVQAGTTLEFGEGMPHHLASR